MTQQRGVVLRRLHLFLEVISMDKRLKEIVDNFDSMKIGVDEPFRFHCTMCGKCCILACEGFNTYLDSLEKFSKT